MDVVELLADIVSGRLNSKEINTFDLNNLEEKQEYKEILDRITESYKEVERYEKDAQWGFCRVVLYENTMAHCPSEKEPTWILVEESANDTGDWTATIYAIF